MRIFLHLQMFLRTMVFQGCRDITTYLTGVLLWVRLICSLDGKWWLNWDKHPQDAFG